jgi:thiosulfate/3-mercaptopyruvate sulfurtransferase
MKKIALKTVATLLFVVVACISFAQNPVNWTKEQLLEPEQLAQSIEKNEAALIVYSIGPGAVIKNSINIGSVKEPANMQEFKKQLSKLPKDASIVVYCGCCPFEHCPNVRPAVAALNEMKFTNYKLLNLSHNVKTDWLDKGYPAAQ